MALIVTTGDRHIFFDFAWDDPRNPHRHLPLFRDHPGLASARACGVVRRDNGNLVVWPGKPSMGMGGATAYDDTPEIRAIFGSYGVTYISDYFSGCVAGV